MALVIDKNFDLYTHMKINVKCASLNCEIHDSQFIDYCLSCKRPVCDICKTSFHSSHPLQNMSVINFENKEIPLAFKRLNEKVNKFILFQNPEACKNQIKQKINKEFDDIAKSLQELKEIKLDEIDYLFKNTATTVSLSDNIINTNKLLEDYISNYKEFFYDAEVKDEDNIILLQTYDLYKDISTSLSEYESIIDEIRNFFTSFESSDINQYKKIKQVINLISEEEKKMTFRSNLALFDKKEDNSINSDWGDNPGNKLLCYFDKLKEDLFKDSKEKIKKFSDFIESFKRAVFESFKKHGSLVDIEKTVKIFDEKTNKRTNFIKGKANLKFSPSQAKAYSVTGVLPSNINYSESGNGNGSGLIESESSNGKKKEPKLKSNEDKFSKSKKSHHNLSQLDCLEEGDEELSSEELENNTNLKLSKQNLSKNNLSEENSKTSNFGDDSEILLDNGFPKAEDLKFNKEMEKLKKMFQPRKKEKKIMKPKIDMKNEENSTTKFKVNNKLQEIIKENQRLITLIKKYDDINLVVTTIRRYYSYVVIEFVRKSLFKNNARSLVSSGVFLDKKFKEEEHSLKDNIKILEGTNEIQIFCREKRKLIKKVIPFNKSTHGVSYFPLGCRTYISRERMYITGGKDHKNNDLKIFLIYNFKDDKLTKLPEMKKARSYHTIIFHENIKSILVFGGENNRSCEIYDIFLNTWNELPELNYGRSNINMYIDKIGTFAYAFCGSIGNISNSTHSDVIELLDLVDINQGWAKVDYNNKAFVDLKFCHNGIYPLTEDKLLIYGAKESRKVHKTFVIFDLRTFDLLNVDDYYLEDLRKQASKNPELSKILMS